jgi:UDP-glucuronate 4-epimerase
MAGEDGSIIGARILVTGAAGFIGSHVVDALLAEGHDVVGIDVYDDFYDPELKAQNLSAAKTSGAFTEVQGDIRDPETLSRLPAEIDIVIHLAARAGVRPSIQDPALYASVNVGGTVSLLEWMRERRVPRLILASSSSVYGDNRTIPFSEEASVDEPISPYAATKRAAELLTHTYHHLFDLSVVALRFFTVYGPRQRPDLAIHKFARLIRDGKPIPMYGDGSTERDYTYVTDILQGVGGALGLVGSGAPLFEVVNLGESRTVSLSEMIRVLGEEMGTEPMVERLPLQQGDVQRTYADTTKATRLFGYRPSVGFREGIRSFLEWFDRTG